MALLAILAVTLLNFSDGGIDFTVEVESAQIDPAKSIFLDAVLLAPPSVEMPDFQERVRGFSVAEDDAEEPVEQKDGRVKRVTHWRLVPQPCAKEYKIAPFVLSDKVAGPIYFTAPEYEAAQKGAMEISPKKDMPPLSWRLVAKVLVAGSLLAVCIWACIFALRHIVRRVREHIMSPIERAWVELDRLLKKGLPGRGRYKDFYVELTQLVRRYVQRKYGIKAPHMTTEEFLREFKGGEKASHEALKAFFESADMVKFAGVEATPDMADAATESARGYLRGDDASAKAAAQVEGAKKKV